MSAPPPTRRAPKASPADEPATAKRGSLRWVREVLGRSIRLEQRNKQLHVVLAPTRQAESPLSELEQQRAELGARLLVHDPATQTVRSLFLVHDELRSGGWRGVSALPSTVVRRAVVEAQLLQSQEATPVLLGIIDRLRRLVEAAEARAAEVAMEREWAVHAAPEVSETNFDEFELMERSWIGTVPSGLDPSAPPPP